MYRIITDSAVVDQLAALPIEALPGYAKVLDVLEVAPWDGRPHNEEIPDVPMRELVFGTHGRGTVTYLVHLIEPIRLFPFRHVLPTHQGRATAPRPLGKRAGSVSNVPNVVGVKTGSGYRGYQAATSQKGWPCEHTRAGRTLD